MGYVNSEKWVSKADALIEEVEAWERDRDAMRVAEEPLPSDPDEEDDGMVGVFLTLGGLSAP